MRSETVTLTPNLTMLVVNSWQVYAWRDGDSVTLIDTGPPGSGAAILEAVPGIDRIILTHGHVDHIGSAAELRAATGASVSAGAGDALAIRTGRRYHHRYSRTGKCRYIGASPRGCPTEPRRCRWTAN